MLIGLLMRLKKLEKKMAFYFENTKKDIVITEDDETDYRDNNICSFCEKELISDKVRDHCHVTGKYRGPAQTTSNVKDN